MTIALKYKKANYIVIYFFMEQNYEQKGAFLLF